MTHKQRRRWNKQVVEGMAGEFDYPIKYFGKWHLRLTLNGGSQLDYFPGGNAAKWVGSKHWFEIDNIEEFLYTYFVDQPI